LAPLQSGAKSEAIIIAIRDVVMMCHHHQTYMTIILPSSPWADLVVAVVKPIHLFEVLSSSTDNFPPARRKSSLRLEMQQQESCHHRQTRQAMQGEFIVV